MKFLRHPVVTALGLTTIILMIFVEPLVSSLDAGALYHYELPAITIVGSAVIVFVAVWFILTLLILLARQRPEVERFVWLGLGIVIARELLEAAYWLVYEAHPATHTQFVPSNVNIIFLVFVLLVGVPASFGRGRNFHIWSRSKGLFISVVGFVAISGAFTLLRFGVVAWKARHLNSGHPMRQIATNVPHHSRILWVILDELSYRQLYEHRYADLQLPAFDRLATEASVLTNVQPAGLFTQAVVPILMSGTRYADDFRSGRDIYVTAAGEPLYLRNATTHEWQKFDEHDTIFQDALNAGYNTSIVGWYNPYCRILADVLTHCVWTNVAPLNAQDRPVQVSALQNVVPTLKELLRPRAHQLRLGFGMAMQKVETTHETEIHRNVLTSLIRAGDHALANPALDFQLIHLPIPHPYGIYDRHSASYSESPTTYMDNLALCDKYLAHLRQELEADGTWDSTTLVIMGDHSWRVQLPGVMADNSWSKSSAWKDSERIASDNNTFDTRPGYIIKLAGQKTPQKIDTSFQANQTRKLFDALLQGRIHTPDELAAWVQHPD